jgi:hypothetical protein
MLFQGAGHGPGGAGGALRRRAAVGAPPCPGRRRGGIGPQAGTALARLLFGALVSAPHRRCLFVGVVAVPPGPSLAQHGFAGIDGGGGVPRARRRWHPHGAHTTAVPVRLGAVQGHRLAMRQLRQGLARLLRIGLMPLGRVDAGQAYAYLFIRTRRTATRSQGIAIRNGDDETEQDGGAAQGWLGDGRGAQSTQIATARCLLG